MTHLAQENVFEQKPDHSHAQKPEAPRGDILSTANDAHRFLTLLAHVMEGRDLQPVEELALQNVITSIEILAQESGNIPENVNGAGAAPRAHKKHEAADTGRVLDLAHQSQNALIHLAAMLRNAGGLHPSEEQALINVWRDIDVLEGVTNTRQAILSIVQRTIPEAEEEKLLASPREARATNGVMSHVDVEGKTMELLEQVKSIQSLLDYVTDNMNVMTANTDLLVQSNNQYRSAALEMLRNFQNDLDTLRYALRGAEVAFLEGTQEMQVHTLIHRLIVNANALLAHVKGNGEWSESQILHEKKAGPATVKQLADILLELMKALRHIDASADIDHVCREAERNAQNARIVAVNTEKDNTKKIGDIYETWSRSERQRKHA